MDKYVFSYRVPADYAPGAGAAAEWQEWFGGMGTALVDLGHAVVEYAALGDVGGTGSRMIGYSVVSAADMDAALALTEDCPALRAGGGIEVGPVMEVPES